MRWWICAVLLIVFSAQPLLAQEEPKPEQLRKQLDDALANLKSAQDRKNELAGENDKLKERLADLEKQLAAAQERLQSQQRDIDEFAEKTFFFRARYAAFEEFIAHIPGLAPRWNAFLQNTFLNIPHDLPELFDRAWPVSATTTAPQP
jgi:DNA repair exonuclease SbcCD ATPase subunit